jgi:hypothetical protein
MKERKGHTRARRDSGRSTMVRLLVLLLLASGLGCKSYPPEPPPPPGNVLRVHEVSKGVPTWLEPSKYNYKMYLSVVFTQPVDVSTLKIPGTVNLTYKNITENKEVSNIPGVAYASPDKQTIVFVSNKTISDLGVAPGGGDRTEMKMTLLGTDAGKGVIKSVSGVILDGDENGSPGGDYDWTSGEIQS